MFIVCPCLKKREIPGTIWTRGSRTLGVRKLGKLYKLIDLWQWGSKSFVFEKFSRWLWNNRFRNLWSRFYWDHFLEASHWLKTASCCWVAESCLTVQPHGLKHAGRPCPSLFPGVCTNSCPLSWWCHPTISSSVVPLSSCLQSFPASGPFQMSQFFTSGGQSVGSFSFNISPSNEYSGLISFRMHWLDLVEVQWTLKSLLQHYSSKTSVLRCSAFFITQISHPYMTTGKTIALTRRTFAGKGMSLLFNMLSRLVITFLPTSKHLLISWLQSPSAVILEPQKIESATVSTVSPSICHKVPVREGQFVLYN